MEINKEKDSKFWGNYNLFLLFLIGTCVISIISSIYFFYYKKNFDFIVETKCDPQIETCFYRDCTNPDDCPPNNLSYFNVYNINARDFTFCENEDCTAFCDANTIKCNKNECTEQDINEGVCVPPYTNMITN